jgi:hypothetical protein
MFKRQAVRTNAAFGFMPGAGDHYKPQVDVMITIFCDFCQFSAKNLAFFL